MQKEITYFSNIAIKDNKMYLVCVKVMVVSTGAKERTDSNNSST